MKNAIEYAKDNLAEVREANKDREAEAAAGVTAAVAEVFTAGLKVKVKDHENRKTGETVKGAEYKVDFVKDTNVYVIGKGQKPKVFSYDELEILG
jgi:hypothetical protein